MTAQDSFNYQSPASSLQGSDETAYTWKPLEFLNAYRFLISVFLAALIYTDTLFAPLGSTNPRLFLATTVGYLALSLVYAPMLHWHKPAFRFQVSLQLLTDIVATILLMHASGGVSSGVGNLLIIAVAGGSIVLQGRHALLFAAVASFAVLGEQFYEQYQQITRANTYTQAGLLGLTLFVTAVLAHLFARRIRESEALAKKRGVDLANMAELTEHIIQRMQTGILVVDGDNRIRLINESAWYMLGMPSTAGAPTVDSLFPPLARQLQTWKSDPEVAPAVVQPSPSHPSFMPRFARLSQEDNPATLIFLEDTSATAQRAQQLQLASLGRLTASIAHEIRNPLGAISHAGQLLAESPNIDTHDTRLTQIISDQSRRMNAIIENVLQLGRRTKTSAELITLHSFLTNFVRDFLLQHNAPAETVSISIDPEEIQIRFDPTHLQQILTNLCDNALRHGGDFTGTPTVEIQGGLSLDMNRPFLDISDHGDGIGPDMAAHIFEPFYTTSTSGSGLGLYISRELAEANQAHLNYIPLPGGGSCFRLSFQDPRRHMH